MDPQGPAAWHLTDSAAVKSAGDLPGTVLLDFKSQRVSSSEGRCARRIVLLFLGVSGELTGPSWLLENCALFKLDFGKLCSSTEVLDSLSPGCEHRCLNQAQERQAKSHLRFSVSKTQTPSTGSYIPCYG